MASEKKKFWFYVKGGRKSIDWFTDEEIRSVGEQQAVRLAESEKRPLIGVREIMYRRSAGRIDGTGISVLEGA